MAPNKTSRARPIRHGSGRPRPRRSRRTRSPAATSCSNRTVRSIATTSCTSHLARDRLPVHRLRRCCAPRVRGACITVSGMSREFAFPGTRPKFAPDRVVDILHIALVLDVDLVARTVGGTATIRCAAIATTSAVELDAVELDIAKVTANGKSAGFRHDGKKLRVELPAPLAAGAELVLAIDYSGSPQRGLYFVGPDDGYPKKPTQVWTQGQDEDSRYWFPCFDSPNEKATSEVTV